MVFRNLVAKQRGKKEGETQIGNDITNIEVVRWLLKSQFDRNMVMQFDIQEQIFDHIFSHLGITTDGCVDHPIVLTETPCNPPMSRQLMSELLFECYQVPKVAFGIDCLFSFHYNNKGDQGQNGLVISSGYNTTHILPVLDGKPVPKEVRRINIGGSHMTSYLHRLLQLKYPAHFSCITLTRAEDFLHNHTYIAENYQEELKKWTDPEFHENNVHRIQLPYTPLPGNISAESGKLAWCETIVKRVKEMTLKRKMERLAEHEERLQQMINAQELLEEGEEDNFIRALQELGCHSAEELQLESNRLNQQIQKAKSFKQTMSSQESSESTRKIRCVEVDLRRFSDPETWIAAVRKQWKELRESRLSRHRYQKTEKLPQLFDCEGNPVEAMDEVSAEHSEDEQDKIFELEEIIAEYNREVSNKSGYRSEHRFSLNIAEYYQLHLGVERIRVPELLFQPCMIGHEQAGVAEIVEGIFANFSTQQQALLAQNVFLTSGCVSISGFKSRIESELLAMRPFQSTFKVSVAADPVLDAWRGARIWSLTGDNLRNFSTTKAEYLEKGGEYFKEHIASNWFVPAMISQKLAAVPNLVVEKT
ncbi:actin-related protein 5 isoform X2 [Tachypleus tridentatus]